MIRYKIDIMKELTGKGYSYTRIKKEKLLSAQTLENIKIGNFPSVDMDKFKKFLIPLPLLEEQQRIVNILDRFDKLCNDISEGLPAEIEARQKQYEYYREKLLTFKKL